MAKRVQLPDGGIGEFPDNMSDDDIAGVLRKQYSPQQEATPTPQQKEGPGFWDDPWAGIKGGVRSGVATGNMIIGNTIRPVVPEKVSDYLFNLASHGFEQGKKETQQSGTFGQIAGGLPAALTGVAPAQAMTQRYMDLTEAGVDSKTAAKAAATTFGVNAISNLAPIGKGLRGGALWGGGTAVTGSVVDRQTTAALIEDQFPDLAKQYRGELKDYVKEGIIGAGIGGVLGHINRSPNKSPDSKIIAEEGLPSTTGKSQVTPPKDTLASLAAEVHAKLTKEQSKKTPRAGVIKKLEKQLAEITTADIDAQQVRGNQYGARNERLTIDENGMPIYEPQSRGIEEQVSVNRDIPMEPMPRFDEQYQGPVRAEQQIENAPQSLLKKAEPKFGVKEELPRNINEASSLGRLHPNWDDVVVQPARQLAAEGKAREITLKDGTEKVDLVLQHDANGEGTALALNKSGEPVGELLFSTKEMSTGERFNEDIFVDEMYRNQNVATELYKYAIEHGGAKIAANDAPDQLKTDMGKGFRTARRNQIGAVNTGFSEAVVSGFKRVADYFKKDRNGNPLNQEEAKTLQAAYRGEVQPDDPKLIEVAIKTPDLPDRSTYTSSLVSPNLAALQGASGGKHVIPEIFYTKYNNIKGTTERVFASMFGEKVASNTNTGRNLILGMLNQDSFMGKLVARTGDNFKKKNTLAGEFANIQMKKSRGENVEFPAHLKDLADAYNKSMGFALDQVNRVRTQLGYEPIVGIENYITASGHKEYYYSIKRPDGSLVETNFQHVSPDQLKHNLDDIKTLLKQNGENVDTLEFNIIRRSGEFTNDAAKLAHAFATQNPAKSYMLEGKRMLSDLDLPAEKSGKRFLENSANYADAIKRYVADMEFQYQTKDLREALESGGGHENTLGWIDNELRPAMSSTVSNNKVVKDTIKGAQRLAETLTDGKYSLPQQHVTSFIKTSTMLAYTKVLLSMNQAVQGMLGMMKMPGHFQSMMQRYGVDMGSSMSAMSKGMFDYATGTPRAKELSKLLYDRGELDQMLHHNDVFDSGTIHITGAIEKKFDQVAQVLGKPDQMARYLAALTLDNALAKTISDPKIRDNIIANEITRVLPDMRVFSKPTAFKKMFGQAAPLITALDTYYAHFWGYALSNVKMAAGKGNFKPLLYSTIVPMMVAGAHSTELASIANAYTNIENALGEFAESWSDDPYEKRLTPTEKLQKMALMKYQQTSDPVMKKMWQAVAGGIIDAASNRDLSKAVTAPSVVPSVGYPIQFLANVDKNIPGAIDFVAGGMQSRGKPFRDTIDLGVAALPSFAKEPLKNLEQSELESATHLTGRGTKTRPSFTSADTSDIGSILGYKNPENKLKELEGKERFVIEANKSKLIKDFNTKAYENFLSPKRVDRDKAIERFIALMTDPKVSFDVKQTLATSVSAQMENALTTKKLTLEQYQMWKKKIATELEIKGQLNNE